MNKKYDKDFVLKLLEPLKLKLKDLEYVHVKYRMEIECENGHTFFRTLDKFIKGRTTCWACRPPPIRIRKNYCDYPRAIKPSLENKAIEACEKLNYKFISYEEPYVNCLCQIGHPLKKKLSTLHEKGRPQCRACAGLRTGDRCRHSYDHIKDYITSEGETLISSSYVNANSMLEVRCSKGHEYPIRFNNFKKGHRCPRCKNKTENFCREIIERLTEKTFPTKRPNFLRVGSGLGQILQLDGYNEELKVAFEYDGEQHYIEFKHYGKPGRLEAQQERDKIKDQKCLENGIKLLRIPYFIKDKEEYIKSWLIENKIISA